LSYKALIISEKFLELFLLFPIASQTNEPYFIDISTYAKSKKYKNLVLFRFLVDLQIFRPFLLIQF